MYLIPTLQKCEYCQGHDGKEKGIYKTLQEAGERAHCIRADRGIVLTAYPCPRGNGFRLTRSYDEHERAPDFPLKSSGAIAWEYIKNENTGIPERKALPKQGTPPFAKIECKNAGREITLSGKLMEIIENINIEKLFQINTGNVFAYNALKPYLTGSINQITLYTENSDTTIEGYTLLIKDDLLAVQRMRKGQILRLRIIGKTIHTITKWVCTNIAR